jgi:GNAT superfamily N-acetyltransferase
MEPIMTAKIRKLDQDDFEDVAALFAELTGEPKGIDRSSYFRVLSFQDAEMFGAEVNGKIVSMATLHVLSNLGGARLAYGLIENVVTLCDFQKQGLGRAVMNKLIETAWAESCYKIMLLTGAETGASGFYEKLGFSGESKIGMQIRKIPVREALNL